MAEPNVITLEEHFWTPGIRDASGAAELVKQPELMKRLDDLGELRIREMDEAGIDLQVLSETAPGPQGLAADTAIAMSRESNNILYETIQAHPDRFAGFATLPTPDPKAAANELERCVSRLGFKGAMINGLTRGRFLDEPEFMPIFERAVALDVPLYIHPSWPLKAVVDAYMKDHPALHTAALGFTIETMTQAMRLVTSGVLDKFPRLKVILGHMGEGLPFMIWRNEIVLSRAAKLQRKFGQYMRDNFWVTTSGAFQHSALSLTIAELGIEHVLYSVDWPFQSNVDGRDFMASAPLSEHDRALVLGGNAKKLLKL
jgi:2,3-dihydroxybenzoate decarboxylase